MEVEGHRRHWIISGTCFLRIALLLCMSLTAVTHTKAEGPKCQEETEFLTNNQICCDKCPPGYKLVANCRGPNHRSNCSRCPPGQYINQFNFARNCFSCKQCKEIFFEVEVSRCERNKNTICRCMDGYYKINIDSRKYECSKCTTCEANETELQKCSPESDTVCTCKDNFYRAKKKCLPCTNCTAECLVHCPKNTKGPPDTSSQLINLVAGVGAAVVVVLVLVIIITYIATKWQTKRKLLKKSSEQCEQPEEMYKQLTDHTEEASDHSLHSVPDHNVTSQEPSNLPDCVPLEIKTPEMIYTVLDLVPVKQVKQLVRCLGVTEAVIEHAELDYRSSREAHYQMLRAWAEKGTPMCRGRQGGVLHRPLLHELLDKLRQMHLEQTAEELETKYNL